MSDLLKTSDNRFRYWLAGFALLGLWLPSKGAREGPLE